MTHTKGPWKVTQNDRGRSIVAENGVVVSLFQSSLIGDMQLMAAAPDMLEALELVKRCDDKGFINLKPGWSRVVNNAIRKAKS